MAAPDERKTRLKSARLYLVIEAGGARSGGPAAPRGGGGGVPPGGEHAGGGGDGGAGGRPRRGGVDVVQLREKHASDEEIVATGRWLREACGHALLVINDRADLALACDADGVHLGQDDEPVESVREKVGADMLIGLSTHSPEQI